MAQYAAIAIEGVLARAVDPLPQAHPINQGVTLFQAMKRYWKVVLLTTATQRDVCEHWCSRNGLEGYTQIVLGASDKAESLRQLRAAGYALEIYIDASPAAVAHAMNLGITGLCFASPAYARPEFRPDAPKGIREWSEIQDEVSTQLSLRAAEPLRTADLHE